MGDRSAWKGTEVSDEAVRHRENDEAQSQHGRKGTGSGRGRMKLAGMS